MALSVASCLLLSACNDAIEPSVQQESIAGVPVAPIVDDVVQTIDASDEFTTVSQVANGGQNNELANTTDESVSNDNPADQVTENGQDNNPVDQVTGNGQNNNPVDQVTENGQNNNPADQVTENDTNGNPADQVTENDTNGNPADSVTGNVANDNTTEDNTGLDDSGSTDEDGGQVAGDNNDATMAVSDVDFSGGNDDSPTLVERLSLAGPSTKVASRGAGPPSTPTNLTRLMAAENWIEFSWAPSVDDQAVKAYEVYRDGQLIATVNETQWQTGYEFDYLSWINTSFMDCNYTRYVNCVSENLQPEEGASYSYSIVAVDNEGMRSPPSEAIVLSTATPGQGPVNLTGYTQVFTEEFDGDRLNLSRWKTSLPWGPDVIINREQQYFVNILSSNNRLSYDPFVFTGETLQITGINTPADQLVAANNQPFLSGALTTSDYFEMTYGYVEMSAKVAKGQGLLSTFYLFNQTYDRNKPEIDIIEYIGTTASTAYQTYHYYDSNRIRYSKGEKHSSPTMSVDTNQDLSDDFHTYSVLWEPELIVWYIDGQEVRRIEGARVSDEPMNIVTQLVMGSEWIGDPDPAAVPAVLEIDYIRAWQKQ